MLTIDELAARAGGVSKLAEIIGVNWSTVCGYKRTRGNRIPIHHARKLSEALEIPLHEIRPDVWPAPSDAAQAVSVS